MTSRQGYALDWSQVNLRRGAMAVGGIVVVVAVLVVFGAIGLTVGLAALFVMAADAPGPAAPRLRGVLAFTVWGASIGFGGAWAGTDHMLVAAGLMAVVVYVATLASGMHASGAMRWLLFSLWLVLALALGGSVDRPWQLSVAFLAGGLLAGVGIWVQSLVRRVDGEGPEIVTPARTIEAARTPLGRFSLIRGAAAGLATYVGALLFPEFPIWVVVSVLVILRGEKTSTLQIGVLRTVGTLLGVLVASLVLALIGDSEALVAAAFLASGFAMVALQKLNYAVFTFFLTAMLVFVLHIRGTDVLEGGLVRLLATLIGTAIAFAAIAFRDRVAGTPTEGMGGLASN